MKKLKAKKKFKFIAQLYIESIYQLCDQMRQEIMKGSVDSTNSELIILDQFLVDIDDFLDKYCYDNRSE